MDWSRLLTNSILTLVLGLATACCCAVVLFFAWLPTKTRRAICLVAITLGSAALLGAYFATGERTTRLRALFLHHHCVVGEPTAPAAHLPLLLGVIALAGGLLGYAGGRSRRLRLGAPLALAAAIAVMRYGIDRAAAPEPLAHAFGVTWSIPALGSFAALRFHLGATRSWPSDLAILSLGVRLPALALNAITTYFDLGSHYSLVRVERIAIPFADAPAHFVPQSLHQFLMLGALPQLVIWPLISLAVAYPCAILTLRLLRDQPSSGAL